MPHSDGLYDCIFVLTVINPNSDDLFQVVTDVFFSFFFFGIFRLMLLPFVVS